jgi:hypothetical protein
MKRVLLVGAVLVLVGAVIGFLARLLWPRGVSRTAPQGLNGASRSE